MCHRNRGFVASIAEAEIVLVSIGEEEASEGFMWCLIGEEGAGIVPLGPVVRFFIFFFGDLSLGFGEWSGLGWICHDDRKMGSELRSSGNIPIQNANPRCDTRHTQA